MMRIKPSEFCRIIHSMMTDIRQEYRLPQKTMAQMIGVSKKTYIQLEKQRIMLKWSEAVTICAIFNESDVLRSYFDDDVIGMIHLLSFNKHEKKVHGRKEEPLFETLKKKSGYALQYNRKAQYYRIIDGASQTIYMHFEKEETMDEFKALFSSLNTEGEEDNE